MKLKKKRLKRIVYAVLAVVMLLASLPFSVSARESGNTVLTEDYYSLTSADAGAGSAQLPGLVYFCSAHNTKMIPHYTTEQNDYTREIPGLIERTGNSIKYIDMYYCPNCYSAWVDNLRANKADVNNLHLDSDAYDYPESVDGYISFLGEEGYNTGNGHINFYNPPKDDLEHAPSSSKSSSGNYTIVAPPIDVYDDEGNLVLNSGKALTVSNSDQPNTSDPLSNWDKSGAFAFYTFFYTGMRTIVNKPTTADDPAWDTVKEATRIYYMQRQAANQIPACRIDYSAKWYNFDYSKLADWRVTDLMVEYATGELCGFATYVGSQSEIAVPEKVNIPVYGDVKIVGIDMENHCVNKIYINDNVTCIQRLSSVNLVEVSGCKNLEYIEKYAFQNDVSLTTLPEMPKLDWIAMGAFEGCVSLRDIKLPDNMTFIDFTAFGWYDTVLGNYDIGMTDLSWEDFQYLSDLSDDDKIYGITLYAKKGSTTYNLLDTLINKNDALTPALDDDGKPYFKSYGDTVAMMSGEIKEFTSHWNLKSSGAYKGTLASSDKDVDDSTYGRLGEYDNEVRFLELIKKPLDWLKKLLNEGGLSFTALLFLLMSLGISAYKYPYNPGGEYVEIYDGISIDISKLRLPSEATTAEWMKELDNFSEWFSHAGSVGEVCDGIYKGGKVIQKALDVYAETGDWTIAWQKGFLGSYVAGEIAGDIADAHPGVAAWDIITSKVFDGAPISDVANLGNNTEHIMDYLTDLAHTWNVEGDPTLDGTVYGSKAFTYEELAQKMMNGDYGTNIQNIALTQDMMNFKSCAEMFNGVFGEEGMGFMEFLKGMTYQGVEDTFVGDSGKPREWLNEFNNCIEGYYAGMTK